MSDELAVRRTAIHLLRSGKAVGEVAQEVERSVAWVYKWRKRFFESGSNWRALEDRSRAPHQPPKKLPESVRQKIRMMRSELEVEAAKPGELSYIGAHAIRGRLRKRRIKPLPSITSIERELRLSGLTKPRNFPPPDEVEYPHVQPREPHQLVQVDIVPRYLPGGPCVACFNAIDVVSRLPTGRQYLSKRSSDAINFLLEVWRDLGIPTYTQVDNESCFSGGFTHPGVLGKVHFIRRVSQDRQIMVLNLKWDLPATQPDQGVWATLQFTAQYAKLRIFDAAPDAKRRSCLAVYQFPIKEPVCQLDPQFQRPQIPFDRTRPAIMAARIARTLGQWISTMF